MNFGRVAACVIGSAVLLVGVACGSSERSKTAAKLDACVGRQTPAISDPLFRGSTRMAVRRFCIFAAAETDVLGQEGSVSEADRQRILQRHPEVVSDICAAPLVFQPTGDLPTDPKTLERKFLTMKKEHPEMLRRMIRVQEKEHKKVCSLFLERLR